jgi:hypothetical protein
MRNVRRWPLNALRRLPNMVFVVLLIASVVSYLRWRPLLSNAPGPLLLPAPSLSLNSVPVPASDVAKLDRRLPPNAAYDDSLDAAARDLGRRMGMPVTIEWDRIGKAMKRNGRAAKETVRVKASVAGLSGTDAFRVLLRSASPADLQLDFGLVTSVPADRLAILSVDPQEREVEASLPWQLLITTGQGIEQHGWTQGYEVGDVLKSASPSALLPRVSAVTGRGGHVHRLGFAGSTLVVSESPGNHALIAAELTRIRWELRVADWHRRVRSFFLRMAIAMGGAVGVAVILWLVLRARPSNPGICTSCAYNLTGNVSGVCPECGTAVEASEA